MQLCPGAERNTILRHPGHLEMNEEGAARQGIPQNVLKPGGFPRQEHKPEVIGELWLTAITYLMSPFSRIPRE